MIISTQAIGESRTRRCSRRKFTAAAISGCNLGAKNLARYPTAAAPGLLAGVGAALCANDSLGATQ